MSTVTVFQLLTGEAWNEIAQDIVAATSKVSLLYFVSWVLIGDFMFLNLFLAVLLESFESGAQEEIRKKQREVRRPSLLAVFIHTHRTGVG